MKKGCIVCNLMVVADGHVCCSLHFSLALLHAKNLYDQNGKLRTLFIIVFPMHPDFFQMKYYALFLQIYLMPNYVYNISDCVKTFCLFCVMIAGRCVMLEKG